MSDLHIYGIRHHGPGSARSVLQALTQTPPDILLVEGPPDAEPVLPLLANKAMVPPVALLVYVTDAPARAAYFPFVNFSPEYQALCYAIQYKIPVRLMDLPQRYYLARDPDAAEPETAPFDPLGALARAAGYDDAERWWDALVEQRQDSADVFSALEEAMSMLRTELSYQRPLEAEREAYMRRVIQEARAAGYQRIAIVCGAWHAPALRETYSAHDAEILAALPEMPVSTTWIPWTFSRLSRASGYGAGVVSPGWYRYLWETKDHALLSTGWLTKVAQHLREKGLDASPAQVIDAVRLVETLAAMRGRALPDLHDMNEAALSVLCHGSDAPMQVIQRDLIVGKAIGRVPDGIPMVPLQHDFQAQVTRFELELSEEESELLLDMRSEMHREISRFMYRLRLLEAPWGRLDESDESVELWQLQWHPGLVIQLVEKSAWGNTILEAATAFALNLAVEATALSQLTRLVYDVLLADLPGAAPQVVQQLENEAALTGEISELMAALPSLVAALTYGDIRRTQSDVLQRVVDGLVVRITIGLPAECGALDDKSAAAMLSAMIACDSALRRLDNATMLRDWYEMLARMVAQNRVHGLIRGRCCRIVLDASVMDRAEAVRQMRLALARMVPPPESAAWLEGFLQGSGLILVHDTGLLDVIDDWVISLLVDDFEMILPLLRRTVSTFDEPEIRHIGRRINGRPVHALVTVVPVNAERAGEVDATLNELLGLKGPDDDQ